MIRFFVYQCTIILLVFVIYIIGFFLKMNKNKLYNINSEFECGVSSKYNSIPKFSIQFYFVGIVFVLFDLETVFIIIFILSGSSFDILIKLILFILLMLFLLVTLFIE